MRELGSTRLRVPPHQRGRQDPGPGRAGRVGGLRSDRDPISVLERMHPTDLDASPVASWTCPSGQGGLARSEPKERRAPRAVARVQAVCARARPRPPGPRPRPPGPRPRPPGPRPAARGTPDPPMEAEEGVGPGPVLPAAGHGWARCGASRSGPAPRSPSVGARQIVVGGEGIIRRVRRSPALPASSPDARGVLPGTPSWSRCQRCPPRLRLR